MSRGPIQQMDTKEFELPDTLFVRDIETRVFQSIVFRCLSQIEGIAACEGSLIDTILPSERIKGISVEQEQKNHSVNIKVEVNVAYGVSLPEKAEEMQTKVAQEVSRLTGLHVGCVHVIFKNLIPPHENDKEPARLSFRPEE